MENIKNWILGNSNAECLEMARFTLTGAIDYAGLNFKSIHTVKKWIFSLI